MAQDGFYFDQTVCAGCHICQLACKVKKRGDTGEMSLGTHACEKGKLPDGSKFHGAERGCHFPGKAGGWDPRAEADEKRGLDKRVHRSQAEIQNAMVRLMKAFPYSAITVTMIAGDAGINRKTFYAYYHNKDELLHAMVYHMFDDLLSCFMYRKSGFCGFFDEARLQRDVRRFLEKVRFYEERLLALVTTETSEAVLSIADRAVLNHCGDICIPGGKEDKFLRKFYLEIIRNFFMGIIDAWMESERISLEEGAGIVLGIMKQSYGNLFCYGALEQGRDEEGNG